MKDISLNTNEYLPLREVVFNTLREAILTGELEPGEHLMEVKLANKLGVSRTPIREAIRKLELEGLVVMTPRRSAEVAKITKEDLVDVLEVRRVLEALSIELCCKNRTKEEIVLLKENLGKFKKSVESGDLTEIAKTDVYTAYNTKIARQRFYVNRFLRKKCLVSMFSMFCTLAVGCFCAKCVIMCS